MTGKSITEEQARQKLKISRQEFEALIASGRLSPQVSGETRLFSAEEIEKIARSKEDVSELTDLGDLDLDLDQEEAEASGGSLNEGPEDAQDDTSELTVLDDLDLGLDQNQSETPGSPASEGEGPEDAQDDASELTVIGDLDLGLDQNQAETPGSPVSKGKGPEDSQEDVSEVADLGGPGQGREQAKGEDEDDLAGFDTMFEEDDSKPESEEKPPKKEKTDKDVEKTEGETEADNDEFDFLLYEEGENEKDAGKEEAGESEADEETGEYAAKDADDGGFLLTDHEEDEEDADEGDFLLTDHEEDEEDSAEDDFDSEDAVTKVIDVKELEGGEDDLLTDVIEDSGKGVSSYDETDDMPSSEVVDEYEMGEEDGLEEEEVDAFDSKDPGSDITELGEDAFDTDLEQDAELEEDEVAGYGEILPETPFPTWAVILLMLVMVIQLLGIIYIVENTVHPGQPTAISEALNVLRFFQ